ncbi:MAG: hypothetical protein GKR87_00345 [Kiritimatiellae bacterium]|nr:hypothetical protein [Kiritimatiellia bacterium]
MTKKIKKQVEQDSIPSRSWTSFIGRIVIISICVVLISYVAVLGISRLAGFTYTIEEHLSDRVGLPLSIGGTYITVGFDLVLLNIRVDTEKRETQGSLSINTAAIKWSIMDLLRPGRTAIKHVDIQGSRLILVADKKGRWVPADLAYMGSWLARSMGVEVGSVEREKGDIQSNRWNADFQIRDGQVIWRGKEGHQASAKGIDLNVTSHMFSPCSVTHCRLTVNEFQSGTGESLSDLRVEWFGVGEESVVYPSTSPKLD